MGDPIAKINGPTMYKITDNGGNIEFGDEVTVKMQDGSTKHYNADKLADLYEGKLQLGKQPEVKPEPAKKEPTPQLPYPPTKKPDDNKGDDGVKHIFNETLRRLNLTEGKTIIKMIEQNPDAIKNLLKPNGDSLRRLRSFEFYQNEFMQKLD